MSKMKDLEMAIQTEVFDTMTKFFDGKVNTIEDVSKEFMLETSQAAGLRGIKDLHKEDLITESILEFQSNRAIRKERIKTLMKERDYLIVIYKSQIIDSLAASDKVVDRAIKKHNEKVKHTELLMRSFLYTLDNSEHGKELTNLLNV